MPIVSGSGGSQPVTGFEHAIMASTSVAPGGTSLPFTRSGGDVLLDYSNPVLPTVVANGTYAFQATVVCLDGAQAGKTFTVYGGIGDGVVSISTNTGALPLTSPDSSPPSAQILLGIGRETVAGNGGPALGVIHDNISNLHFAGDLYITRLS